MFYYGTDAVAGWNPFADDDDNNGNVRRALHYVPTAVNGSGDVTAYVIPQLHDYSYDALNRISGMLEWQLDGSGNWQSNVVTQNYGYDRFGNRGITSASGGVNNFNPGYTASTNRISSSLTYDSAGNITYDAASGGTMTYDAENHMVTASSGGTYVYDGEGKRVKRTASSQEWWYVYGIGGELVAEYLSTGTTTVKKEYGYRGGQLLVLWDADKSGDERLKWLVQDHLGSTRMEADKSGSLSAMVRHDYLPFGEELTAGIRGSGYGYVSTNVRQKFTGYERDSESGLDFAQARHYANVQGRFASVDKVFFQKEMVVDPQRFNLYAYVRNNPLRFFDPSGDDIELIGSYEDRKKLFEALQQGAGKAGSQLYIQTRTGGDGNKRYFVEISGDAAAFEKLNEVAGELAPIIADTKVASLQFAEDNSTINNAQGDKITFSAAGKGGGVLGYADNVSSDLVRIHIARPKPGSKYEDIMGFKMKSGRPGSRDLETISYHELGHARAYMTGDVGPVSTGDAISLGLGMGGRYREDNAALRLENKVRKLRDPSADTRTTH